MLHREEIEDCGGEDIIAPKRIDCLTPLEVLDPYQNESGELSHVEVV